VSIETLLAVRTLAEERATLRYLKIHGYDPHGGHPDVVAHFQRWVDVEAEILAMLHLPDSRDAMTRLIGLAVGMRDDGSTPRLRFARFGREGPPHWRIEWGSQSVCFRPSVYVDGINERVIPGLPIPDCGRDWQWKGPPADYAGAIALIAGKVLGGKS
jgi:hypothetical protein